MPRYQPLKTPDNASTSPVKASSTVVTIGKVGAQQQQQPLSASSPSPDAAIGPESDPYLLGPTPRSSSTGRPTHYQSSGRRDSSTSRYPSPFLCSCGLDKINKKMLVGYSAGALFAIGWWLFIDGVAFVASRSTPLPVPVAFEDWVPGIISTFALIIVNIIDKETLNADEWSHNGTHVATRARFCAFIGLTMALGALCGSIVILCIKYAVPGYSGQDAYFGGVLVAQNFLIFIGSMIMWFGRNSSDEGGIAL